MKKQESMALLKEQNEWTEAFQGKFVTKATGQRLDNIRLKVV